MKINEDKLIRSCFYYWFIEPLKSLYKDDGSLSVAFSIPVKTQFGDCDLTLLLDSQGQPDFVRLKMPGFIGGELQELKQEHMDMLQTVKEHLLSVLRIAYDPKTEFARYSMWAFPEDGKPYSYGISIQQIQGKLPDFPSVAVRSTFVSTWENRTEIKLFTDALDERIPLQYRYLSFYKILENHFKTNGRWRNDELKAFLNQFSDKFIENGDGHLPLDNHIHALRDKCAHIKTNKNILGITQLSQRQAAEVMKVLPLMKDMCVSLLNTVSKGKFTLRTHESIPTTQTPML